MNDLDMIDVESAASALYDYDSSSFSKLVTLIINKGKIMEFSIPDTEDFLSHNESLSDPIYAKSDDGYFLNEENIINALKKTNNCIYEKWITAHGCRRTTRTT